MHILVTGGAGYIGSTLVGLLLERGHQVTVVDNFMFGQLSLGHLCHLKDLKIVQGDIRDERTIGPLLKEADLVIPLAALVGMPICNKDPIGAKTTNFEAIRLMLDILSPSQPVLMPTTNSAYGSGDEQHFCDENSPLNPISTYAQHKVEVEKMLMDRGNAISFRLATVFGPSSRMRMDLLVNHFVHRALTDSTIVLFESHFKRNYIHIRDVCEVFLRAIDHHDMMNNQIYNVGLSDANISKLELCERIKRFVPNFTILQYDLAKDIDQRNYIVSNEKIEATGFKPKYSIDDGIQSLIQYYNMLGRAPNANI